MYHPSAMATAIADALPRGCTLSCGPGPAALGVLYEVVAQKKCASIVTNNPLCIIFGSELRITLVNGPHDKTDFSIGLSEARGTRSTFSTDYALISISGINTDGELFAATAERAAGSLRFISNATKGVFLLATPTRLLTGQGTSFGNVADLASQPLRTVLATDCAYPTIDRADRPLVAEKLLRLRKLSERFPAFEVWSFSS